MKRNIRLVVAALVAVCASFVAEAANHANIIKGVFLDATTGMPLGTARYVGKNGSDTAGDGSADNPYLTIQKAISMSSAGDTVFVGPGTYSDATPCGDGASTPTIAIVDKKIYLKSTDGKESTIILGQHGTTTGGCGTGARRCIYTSAVGAVVDGFTLLNGATVKTTGGNDSSSCGGGIVANTDGGQDDAKGCHGTVQAWIVNSTIDNCRANHGAAIGRGVVPINCLIRRNVSIDGNHCTYRSYCSYNCIYEGNGGGSGYALAIACGHCAVNCTFLLNQAGTNPGAAPTERGRSYNCAFIGNQDEAARSTYSLVSHCVTTFTTGFVAADENSKKGVYRFQYASPLMGDYTVVGDDLVDAGSDDLLEGDRDWIPAEFKEIDFYGNPRRVGAGVDAGAVERQVAPTVTSTTGFIALGDTNIVLQLGDADYRALVPGVWYRQEICPGQMYRMKAAIPAGRDIYGYKMVGNSGAWTVYHYPEMKPDKGFYMMPLYTTSCSNVTLSAVLTDSVKYAQPGLADYTGADGSEAKPYETIQQAIDAVATWGVVYAKPGIYDKGFTTQGFVDGQDTNSTPSRVYVNKSIRVSSTDGAEVTIIQGVKDTRATGAYDGCGPAAIRCVHANQSYYSCVQGFTLSGGATDGDLANRGSWDKDGSGNPRFNSSDSLNRGNFGGGGYRCGNWRNNVEVGVLADSIITNCVAYFGSAAFGANLVRCTITGNTCVTNDPGYTQGDHTSVYNSQLRGCLVYGNDAAGGSVVAGGSKMRFSTFYRQPLSDAVNNLSVLADSTTYKPESVCIDPAHGDFRIHSGSSALLGGWMSESDLVKYSSGDRWANPVLFGLPNGYNQFIVGGCQIPAVVCRIMSEHTGDTSQSVVVLNPGESYTFSGAATAAGRRLVGFRTPDGELHEQDGLEFTYTAPAYDYPLFKVNWYFELRTVYSSDWYVNPMGDDTNDGWSPETPKRTLAGAMGLAASGDTVHAAPGDYNEGEMTNTVAILNVRDVHGSRVVIPAGVALIADEGPEETTIWGRWHGDTRTAGPTGLRAVYMYEGARLEGFTVTHGVGNANSKGGVFDDNCGGNVLAPPANATHPAYIVNCILSQGKARSGGAAYGGILERCWIKDCDVDSDGITYSSRLTHCLMTGCGRSVLRNHYGARSCTIVAEGASGDADLTPAVSSATIDNTILYYKGMSKETTLKYAHNCLIHAWPNLAIDASCTDLVTNDVAIADSIDLTTYRPLGPAADVVDKGDNTRLAAYDDGKGDFGGGQRVYNGRTDIGCYEFDWRRTYAATLVPGGRLTVTNAAPQVVKSGTAVEVLDGELNVLWPLHGHACTFGIDVQGNGTLTLYRNDEVVETFTAASPKEYLLRDTGLEDTADFRFVYARADGDTRGARLSNFISNAGTVILFR